MKTKRAWTRDEKWLFLTPLLIVFVVVIVARKKSVAPVTIPIALVNEVQFSPDGRRLAVISGFAGQSTATIFDSATGAHQISLQPSSTTSNVSLGNITWSPDGSQLATSWKGGTVGTATFKRPSGIERNLLVDVAIWNAMSGAQATSFPLAPANEFADSSLAWDADGKLWNNQMPPSLLDEQSGKRLRRFGPAYNPGQMPPNALNPRHSLFWLTKVSKARVVIYIHRVSDGQLVKKLKPLESNQANIQWSPDENVMALNWFEPSKKNKPFLVPRWQIVDARTGRVLPTPNLGDIESVVLGPDGHLALIYHDLIPDNSPITQSGQRIMMWDFHRSHDMWQVGDQRPLSADFKYWSFSPDGRYLTALDWREDAENSTAWVIWDVESGKEICRFKTIQHQQFTRLVWSPDHQRVAVYDDNGIQIYELPVK